MNKLQEQHDRIIKLNDIHYLIYEDFSFINLCKTNTTKNLQPLFYIKSIQNIEKARYTNNFYINSLFDSNFEKINEKRAEFEEQQNNKAAKTVDFINLTGENEKISSKKRSCAADDSAVVRRGERFRSAQRISF